MYDIIDTGIDINMYSEIKFYDCRPLGSSQLTTMKLEVLSLILCHWLTSKPVCSSTKKKKKKFEIDFSLF